MFFFGIKARPPVSGSRGKIGGATLRSLAKRKDRAYLPQDRVQKGKIVHICLKIAYKKKRSRNPVLVPAPIFSFDQIFSAQPAF
jgi:hypothetical protein